MASATSTTAPSTHPPETAPTTCPSCATAILVPTGWGADFLVSTTVASATHWPARAQESMREATSVTSSRHGGDREQGTVILPRVHIARDRTGDGDVGDLSGALVEQLPD